MTIKKQLIFALCASISLVAGAQGLVLSCSAKAVYGRSNDLSVYEREGHSPSIVIDLAAQTIAYEYSRDGQSFQFIYDIQENVDGVLWAVEPSETGRKNHLSFDMNSLKFSTSHLNGGFNMLKFGSCSKTI
jgi:hypothetical protein